MNKPVFAILLGLSLVATAFGQTPSDPPPSEPVILDIRENDTHLKASLQAGQTLLIRVAGNPTTGYSWENAGISDPAIIALQGEIKFEDPNTSLLGAPGRFLIRISALREGQATLELVYRRSWEKDTPPLKTVSIDIHVSKSTN